MEPRVIAWSHAEQPSKETLDRLFKDEGLSPQWWSNGPGDRYAGHTHTYHKVLYCAEGSITFRLESSGESIQLHPGDRLDLPPGTVHSASVGPEGCSCIEAARRE